MMISGEMAEIKMESAVVGREMIEVRRESIEVSGERVGKRDFENRS